MPGSLGMAGRGSAPKIRSCLPLLTCCFPTEQMADGSTHILLLGLFAGKMEMLTISYNLVWLQEEGRERRETASKEGWMAGRPAAAD